MDNKTFWLIAFVLIGLFGASLTVARRYNNKDTEAGSGVTAWTVVLMCIWVIAGAVSFFSK